MMTIIDTYLHREGITLFAPVPLSACRLVRPYLLEQHGIRPENATAVIMAVPYYTPACDSSDRNLSAYAASPDYHRYFAGLFDRLLPSLAEKDPQHHYVGFADHSPIDEVHAAALAGIGVLGDNHLLLTQAYSSYIFLGEIITDTPISSIPGTIAYCHHCGACQKACPKDSAGGVCLSALTQKKRNLTDSETAALLSHPLIWGCDICQEVCPYTLAARKAGTLYSPIPYFLENALTHLTAEQLDQMDEATFQSRAFAWRGRETIRRNLRLKSTEKSTHR